MEPVLLDNTVTPKRFGVITPDALDFQRYISPLSRPRRLSYHLFCRCWIWRCGHDTEDRHLVCGPHQTKLESAQLDFWPGLVSTLFFYGDCCLVGLAARRFH